MFGLDKLLPVLQVESEKYLRVFMAAASHHQQTQQEILAELRRIRSLLENQQEGKNHE